eukprot:scaffold128_cov248-Pinguiococcus_pyrenoidosus.AAC.36
MVKVVHGRQLDLLDTAGHGRHSLRRSLCLGRTARERGRGAFQHLLHRDKLHRTSNSNMKTGAKLNWRERSSLSASVANAKQFIYH